MADRSRNISAEYQHGTVLRGPGGADPLLFRSSLTVHAPCPFQPLSSLARRYQFPALSPPRSVDAVCDDVLVVWACCTHLPAGNPRGRDA